MLFDRTNWPLHRPWLIVFIVGTLGALGWFLFAGYDSAQWPGGSSLPGFTFGVVGGLLIVFEFLLWLRKKVRVWRIGSAQAWLRAHIWLGLLCLPLLILHSGLRFGGTLTTALMVLLVLVILSGVWGLILQNVLPRLMIEETPGEASYGQMEFVVGQLLAEGDQLVAATCGAKMEIAAVEQGLVIVALARRAPLRVPAAPIAETEALAAFYRDEVGPFLRDGAVGETPLARASTAAVVFQNVKALLPPAAHDVVDSLENLCKQRRQWDRQDRLHFWLHNWLWVHFPLSVALLVLMAAHVFVALKYW